MRFPQSFLWQARLTRHTNRSMGEDPLGSTSFMSATGTFSTTGDGKETVRVAVRVRPLNHNEVLPALINTCEPSIELFVVQETLNAP